MLRRVRAVAPPVRTVRSPAAALRVVRPAALLRVVGPHTDAQANAVPSQVQVSGSTPLPEAPLRLRRLGTSTRVVGREPALRVVRPGSGMTPAPASFAQPAPALPSVRQLPFPRVANFLAWYDARQNRTMARYGLVAGAAYDRDPGAPGPDGTRLAPGTLTTMYVGAMTPSFDPATRATQHQTATFSPTWWLRSAGTTLAADITDTIGTAVQVASAAPFAAGTLAIVDNELVRITGLAGTTLTVERGVNSTAATHSSGAAIAPLAGGGVDPYGNVYGNIVDTTSLASGQDFAEVGGVFTNWTFRDWLVNFIGAQLAGKTFSGLILDNGGPKAYLVPNVDADNDGAVDYAMAWGAALASLAARLAAQYPGLGLQFNGGQYPPVPSGQLFESFGLMDPTTTIGDTAGLSGWFRDVWQYLATNPHGAGLPLGIVNVLTGTGRVFNATGLPRFRFALGTALLGDGWICVDQGAVYPTFAYGGTHGQLWWLDEFDAGAGSCLAAPLAGYPGSAIAGGTADTAVLATGGGARFAVGDVVRIPGDLSGVVAYQITDGQTPPTLNPDEEQLLITAVDGDVLSVIRGYGGTVPQAHSPLQKVMTDAQVAAGLGWLGAATGPYQQLLNAAGLELLTNGSMEAWTGSVPTGWTTGSAAGASTINRDTGQSSGYGLRADVSRVTGTGTTSSPFWNSLRVRNVSQALSLTADTYTLSFWARSSVPMWPVQFQVRAAIGGTIRYAQGLYIVDSTWQHYSATFVLSLTEADVLDIGLGGQVGSIWLDGVSLQAVDMHLYRRDFAHGCVIVNATHSTQAVEVGAGYAAIAGSQAPSVNHGGAVTLVSLASQDAAILHRT